MSKNVNPSKEMNYKNIIIVNVHSSLNAGDYALLLQTIYYLRETYGNISTTIMANWPDEMSLIKLNLKIINSPWRIIRVWDKTKKPRYQVLSLIYGFLQILLFQIDFLNLFTKLINKDWLNILYEYQTTDLVVAVSGNQMFSSGRYGWPLPVIGLPIFMAKIFKKKTIIFPQSIGPLKTTFEKMLVRYLYNNVEKLFIRDIKSLELIHSLNITNSQPSFMHDVAFTFPPDNKESVQDFLRSLHFKETNKNIGMTIISSMPSYLSSNVMNNYYSAIAEMIDQLVTQHNFEFFLFCQVYGPTDDENDFFGIKRVINTIPQEIMPKVHTSDMKLTAFQLKACYGLMDLFIASRLHSGIFSMGMRVPTFFIGYLYKTEGVLRQINMEEYLIDLNEITEELLVNQVLDMWNDKQNIQKRLDNEMKNIENQLSMLPEEIKKLYE